MKKYYVYLFLDKSKPGEYIYEDIKLSYEPFYVGKGTGDRIIISKYDKESPFKFNKINKIRKSGGEIISIKLYDNLENEESLEVEKLVISKIGRRDLGLGTLVNQTDGGDGRLTSPHSEETKLKISETKKSQNLHSIVTEETKEHLRLINMGENNPMFGKTHTDEIKEDQSLRVSGINHPMFGKTHSKETIDRIRENRNKSVDQDKSNIDSRERNSKSVLQFSLSGEFIQEFKSIKIAAIETGRSESIIGKSCRGVIKNPRSFIFKFKDDSSRVLNNSFEYKIGDIFILNNSEYILLKRNKMSCIASKDGVILSFRKRDCLLLWEKKTLPDLVI